MKEVTMRFKKGISNHSLRVRLDLSFDDVRHFKETMFVKIVRIFSLAYRQGLLQQVTLVKVLEKYSKLNF